MKLQFLPSAFMRNPTNVLGRMGFVLGTLFLGQWFLNDFVHYPGGGLGLFLTGAGIWWLSKPISAKFDTPLSLQGWIRRCQKVLADFELLDNQNNLEGQAERVSSLNQIISRNGPQTLGLVSSQGEVVPDKKFFVSALGSSQSFDLSISDDLPLADESWIWPEDLYEKEVLLYFLPLPLTAADLLWLERIPDDQPAWVLVQSNDEPVAWADQLKALHAQLPHRWTGRVLKTCFSNDLTTVQQALLPVKRVLENPKKNLDITKQRLLSRLHAKWQSELENLRRAQFRSVQIRSQWIVAGAVFASPVPSVDLLAVTVVNGLMMKEMTKIWSCSWKPDVLETAARQLAGAAIAQGVVEWSGQALLSAAKLDGTSWIAAGSLQALNAAYLTRVVGSSMADWLALNNGVKEPDLEVLKKDAAQLVAKAAENERLDWQSFLKQASSWMTEKALPGTINASA